MIDGEPHARPRRAPGPGPASFEERFDELAIVAFRVAHRLLGVRAEAEEVSQEALTRAYVRWRRVEGHAEPWVARVAANLALDQLRRRRRAPDPVASIAPGGSEATATVDRLALVDLLRRLPRRQRQVVVLRYLADLSERETAAALGTSVGSVKQHAHRALARLRVDLDLDPDPDPDPDAAAARLAAVPDPGGS